MTFWALAGLMVAVALAAILWPLLRGRRTAVEQGDDNDVSVYKDQLAEIERDLARGVLGQQDAAAARLEIERRLLTAAERPAHRAVPATRGTKGAVAVLLVLTLPLAAFLLYWHLGSPGLPGAPFAARQNLPPAEMQAQVVSRLKERLAENPHDVEAWLVLGNVYEHLGRWAEAAEAFGGALQLEADNLEAQTGRAEALVAQAQGLVTPEAARLIASVLERDPQNPSALYYSGLALAQNGHLKEAQGIWSELLAVSPADAPWRPVLQQQLARLAAALGEEAAPPGPAPAPGPSQEEVEAAGEMSPADREAFIRSMVQRLADRLAENPDDLEGWLRLARAYSVLGETAEAEKALAAAEGLVAELPADSLQRAAVAAAREALAGGR